MMAIPGSLMGGGNEENAATLTQPFSGVALGMFQAPLSAANDSSVALQWGI